MGRVLKKTIYNTVIFFVLVYCNYYFFEYGAQKVPSDNKLAVNLVAFPFVFGLVEWMLIRGQIFYIVGYLILVQLSTMIVVGFEGDPAKPGLENFLMLSIITFNILGFAVAYFLAVGIGKVFKLGRH